MAPHWRMASLFGIYVLASAWRISEYDSVGWNAAYYRFDTRISGLVCGALLAMWLQHRGPIPERVANFLGVLAASALVLCLSVGFWGAPWSLVYMTTLAEMAGIGLLIAGTTERSWVNSILAAPALVGIGVISYGLYLWHYPAAVYFRTTLPWYQTVPIVLSFSIAMAAASYFLIERPLQAYRRSLRENQRAAHNKAVSSHQATETQNVAAAT
jgi:peptidoglycan/LPS O-acetylase OafA/YrhL